MGWHISIDTGGTFTDGLARDPAGAVRRTKVLSTGAIRARILRELGVGQYEITEQWDLPAPEVLRGFRVHSPLAVSGPETRVLSYDPERRFLQCHSPLPGLCPGDSLELFTGEEAPVVAARLLTGTAPGEAFPPLTMRLGSTRGTNALLEQKGARVALLVNEGLSGLLEIGTQARPELFALAVQKPPLLYETLVEVPGRLDAEGKEIEPLTATAVAEVIEAVKASGCTAIAIALMHAYRNPVHEQKLVSALRQAGYVYVSASHEVAPAIRLLPRAQATIVNAFLAPVIETYLDGVQKGVGQAALKVMTSAGGLVDASHFLPKDSLLSGPA
ncbi:MAG: 5-oxoprolinase, partial [Bacteroidetes bacterium]